MMNQSVRILVNMEQLNGPLIAHEYQKHTNIAASDYYNLDSINGSYCMIMIDTFNFLPLKQLSLSCPL